MVSQFEKNRKNEEAIRNGIRLDELPSWLPHVGHCDVLQVFCFKSTNLKKNPLLSRYKGTCDGDNLEKLTWDALNEILWFDDCWISMWAGKKIHWKEDGVYILVRFYE